MPYGIIKVDQVTFTNAGADQTISVSGIVASISGNITATGTISGNVIRGGTLVSGATVTGTAGQFGTITGNTAGFTTVTGTTVTGTTAQFTTVTGGTAGFTTITGGTATITSGVFASGTAAAPSVSVGTTDNGIYSPGADQVAVATNGTGRLFVASDGSVGIGQASDNSNYRLNIYNSSADFCAISIGNNVSGSGASNGLVLAQNQADSLFLNRENGYMSFSTNNTEKLRITSGGLVGVGTSVPLSTLTVSDSTVKNGTMTLGNDASYHGKLEYIFSAGEFRLSQVGGGSLGTTFYTGGSERLRITSAGFVGIGTSSPGARLSVETGSSDTIPFITSLGIINGTEDQIFLRGGGTGNYYDFRRDTSTGRLEIQGSQTGFNDICLAPTSGRVGIGTTSPSAKLQVGAGSTDGINLDFNGTISTGSEYSSLKFTASAYSFTGAEIRGIHTNGGSNLGVLGFHTAGSERARIDSSGRLLVGTSTSSDYNQYGSAPILQVIEKGGNNSAIGIERADGANASNGTLQFRKTRSSSPGGVTSVASGDGIGSIQFSGTDGTNEIPAASIAVAVDGTPGANDMPGRLVFSTTADGASSPTERMRITSGGEILIGVTSVPTAGNVNGTALNAPYLGDTASMVSAETSTGGSYRIVFLNSNGLVGSISTSGSGTSYTTSSDYRLKENIAVVTDGITRLQQLKPSRFNFIADPDRTVDGFIAHEAQAVVPECVTGTKDEVDDDGNPVYQGIDQSKLVPLLTAALQEAIGRIETLEAEVSALKGA